MRILLHVFIIFAFSVGSVFGQEKPPSGVVLSAVTQQEVAENRSFIGLIYYDRKSHVSSEVAGLVKKTSMREGDRLSAGSPLVLLDTEILDTSVSLARIRISQIVLRMEQAEKNYKRLEKLHAEDGASEKNYEDVLYTWKDLIEEKKAVEEELKKLLISKEKSIIRAPFDGVILEKQVDDGDWVQQGKELAGIGSIHDVFARVPLAEDLVPFVRVGEEVPVIINAFNKEVKGIIDGFDPVADAMTKNVFLKVRLPELKEAAENMSVQVYVPTGTRKTYSIIPRDALIKFQGEDFVYTVKEGKASILPAHIVSYLGDQVAVDNPYFVPGMKVVVEGNERLRPDQPVFVAGEK